MNKLISLLLALIVLLSLFGCRKETAQTSTPGETAPIPTTTAGCKHVYTNADCVNPKTCILCGHIRGSALGHDYHNGACTRCAEPDASFVSLEDGTWRMDGLSTDGSRLEYISLTFGSDGTAQLRVSVYGRLSDLSENQWPQYESNLYDYSGELYYPTGTSRKRTMQYSIDGDLITCTVSTNGEVTATLILERTAGTRLRITFYEGDLGTEYILIDDVLSCNYE